MKANKMKIWLLRPRDDLPANDNPWQPRHDKAHGFVVRAATAAEAREMAQAEGGYERGYGYGRRPIWTDEKYATCVELLPEGAPGVVMEDFQAS